MSQVQKEKTTKLGFYDISERLSKGKVTAQEYDVVRSISLFREIFRHHDDGSTSKVYYFNSPEYNMRGMIFPNDEILSAGDTGDIIIQKVTPRSGREPWDVYANWYYDFKPGERMTVKVAERNIGRDPAFKLFCRITGFIKPYDRPDLYRKIVPGNIVLVEVAEKMILRIHPLFKPLEIIR